MNNKKSSTKQIAFLGVLIILVGLFVAGSLLKGRQQVNKIITTGDRAPEFRLQATDNRFVSLSDLKGRVVMVHFWATWCPPCVEELPTLDKLYRALKGEDFEMLAISVNEEGAAAVVPFMQKNRLNVPVLFDPGKSIAGLYGTYKFPETYIVDRQGIVRYKAIGPADWTDPAAIQMLRDIIAAR
jgi:peroxiredoxin